MQVVLAAVFLICTASFVLGVTLLRDSIGVATKDQERIIMAIGSAFFASVASAFALASILFRVKL